MSDARPDGVGVSRHVRATTVAGACVVSTAVLHAAAGGALPVFGLLVAAAAAYGLATALTQRRLSLPVAAAGLLGCQGLMHLVLTVTGTHGSHSSHGGGFASWPSMVGAHVAAAVVTAAVLSRVDDLVERWLAFWRALRAPLPSSVVPAPDRGLLPGWHPADVSVPSFHLAAVRRRGPPRS